MYKYQDQIGEHTITEGEILDQYFLYWSMEMINVGRANLISDKHCIEDFITVHWAWEVKDDVQNQD